MLMKNLKHFNLQSQEVIEKNQTFVDFDYDFELLTFWSELSPNWHSIQQIPISPLKKDT